MNHAIDEKKIIYADLDTKEGVLLNLDTKNYYRLNETGQVVWQGIAAGKSAEEIADTLTETFEIDRSSALSDVSKMFSHLRTERLLMPDGGQTTPTDVVRARASKKGRTGA